MKRTLAIIVLLFISCTQTIFIQQSPSELILTTVKSYKTNISYSISSSIDEPYSYKSGSGYTYQFPVISALDNNLDAFFNIKFASSQKVNGESGVDYQIKVIISEYEFNHEVDENLYTSPTHISSVKLQGEIIVLKSENELGRKDISISSTYHKETGQGATIQSIFSNAADDCINKAILTIDKYLDSILDEDED